MSRPSPVKAARRREDRCDAVSYDELLDADSRPVPAALREKAEPSADTSPVPIEHYLSEDFFRRSIPTMWLKTWQMACREEEIPNVGDYVVYELVGKSLLIVRSSPDEIKALYNTCLHRGRKLMSHRGCQKAFKCAFHGFVWNIDGTFRENPMQWDFPHCPPEKWTLPEAKVGRWGGFVFINFDRSARSLESVLAPIPRHFERWPIGDRYMSVHVAKVIACNWMVAAEAFMEAHHSFTTHPQVVKASGDANAAHDIYSEHVSRMIAAKGISSPFFKDKIIAEDEIVRCMLGNVGRNVGDDVTLPDGPLVPSGGTARAYIAEFARAALSEATGRDFSFAADAEVTDTITYTVFPNFVVYGGFLPNFVMQWKPNGLDHETCIMELMILRPVAEGAPRPKPAQLHTLTLEQNWRDAEELGVLGPVIDQDGGNMPYVQQGLRAADGATVELGRYTEARIRAFHKTLEKYVNG